MNGLPKQLARQRMRPRTSDVRGEYFRDQTAIIHSTPFRRLKHKTQVFFAPENDHICTRIEHVLHVATIAATICRGLNHHGWQLDTCLLYTSIASAMMILLRGGYCRCIVFCISILTNNLS